jgi:putative ABC transport system substrate-binding protein
MQFGRLKRRQFMSLLGSAAAWPLVARAQQPAAQPLIGFLSTRSPAEAAIHTNAFRRGLEEMGYSEGRSVAVEYRWAEGDYSRLPPFVADLLSRPLSVMVAAGDPAAHAAKAAGVAVPLVFVVGQDPVRSGLVTSMNRPGMATGVNFFTSDLGGKRLELLCTMVPSARLVGLLLNPSFGIEATDQQRQAVAAAARTLGREFVVQEAATDAEIEAGFAALVKAGITALVVQNDPFFDSRRSQIVALSSRHRLPGIFHIREFPAGGGLMSYGASLADTYRQVGLYVGKIMRGAKPDDLPVLRPTKFELVINMQTAKTLDLAVPQPILIAADELIE